MRAGLYIFISLLFLAPGFVAPTHAEIRTAIFAGGCFWCVEKDFESVPGVIEAVSGYTGGRTENPTYQDYSKNGHVEAVKITYDSKSVSYDELLHTFWRSVNPLDAGGQFCDRGSGYTTAIFGLNASQITAAQTSRAQIEKANRLPGPIVTPIKKAGKFHPAEDFHQDYYKKNPRRYGFYRWGCGRDKAIEALWGDEAHSGIVKDDASES